VTPERLATAFQDHFDAATERTDLLPGYCLSVNSVPDRTVEEVGNIAQRPNGDVCVTTVARIVAAGFAIQPTPGKWERDGHCDVYVESGSETPPTQEQLDALAAAFDDPVENPWEGRRGAR